MSFMPGYPAPVFHLVARLLGDLELRRQPRFLLHDSRARRYPGT
ncbi:hypothetical protein AWB67_05875 [Caballeronia terrestris]|uniref:Uncharacterized protein n=1 Tax=Caballeronia terrestris TaxID=1226301 RepID=A0A158KK54_9BURK|nr:hypothetical protein AWB67_05875 [Caballeronia terrestris]